MAGRGRRASTGKSDSVTEPLCYWDLPQLSMGTRKYRLSISVPGSYEAASTPQKVGQPSGCYRLPSRTLTEPLQQSVLCKARRRRPTCRRLSDAPALL